MKKIINKINGVIYLILLIILTVGAAKFYSVIIQGLDWTGITFYSFLMLIILIELFRFLNDALNLMIKGEWR